MLLHKATYMKVVVITYNKEREYSLKLSYKIKSVCILYYYMTIDIHKAIGKLSIIPKRGFVLPNMNYCGAYNPLNKQLIYDKNGNTLKYMQKPSGKTDELCAQHDVDYDLSKSLKTNTLLMIK